MATKALEFAVDTLSMGFKLQLQYISLLLMQISWFTTWSLSIQLVSILCFLSSDGKLVHFLICVIFLQAYFRSEEVETATLPPPLGGRPIHKVIVLWIPSVTQKLCSNFYPAFSLLLFKGLQTGMSIALMQITLESYCFVSLCYPSSFLTCAMFFTLIISSRNFLIATIYDPFYFSID